MLIGNILIISFRKLENDLFISTGETTIYHFDQHPKVSELDKNTVSHETVIEQQYTKEQYTKE